MRFRMVLKVDAGISRFGYPAAMRIEEANSILESSAFPLNNELMVEVPRRLSSLECARCTFPSPVRRRERSPQDYHHSAIWL